MIQLLLLPFAIDVFAADTPTESSVRSTETRWSEAFITGDNAMLESLLDPDYVSTSVTGKPRTKSEIIALTSVYAKTHPGQHGQPLPATSTIRVIGNAALVQHHNPTDTSVDVFYFRDGRWVAWYSQDTKLASSSLWPGYRVR